MTYASFSRKKKKRLREIDFEKLEEMRKVLKYDKKQISDLLGISTTQYYRYSLCGKAPADRFYAARDALLVIIEEEAREKREKILDLFKS